MAKTKRPDEKLKHSFKSVRKAIQKRYREPSPAQPPAQSIGPVLDQHLLNAAVLESNAAYIELFNAKNVTKTGISELKKCRSFMTTMEDYIESGFATDEIRFNVLDKNEEIMAPNLTVAGLLTALMTKQKKNGWIVQDIINSIEYLRDCPAAVRTRRDNSPGLPDQDTFRDSKRKKSCRLRKMKDLELQN